MQVLKEFPLADTELLMKNFIFQAIVSLGFRWVGIFNSKKLKCTTYHALSLLLRQELPTINRSQGIPFMLFPGLNHRED